MLSPSPLNFPPIKGGNARKENFYMKDIQTELECISMRLEMLNEESRRLYKLLENFKVPNTMPPEEIKTKILETLEKRKKEMRGEIEELSIRIRELSNTEY